MKLKITKTCRDCGAPFDTHVAQRTKCENCLERDQCYKERAIQERIENQIEEDQNNVNV